jgi:DNA-binding transcriptional ArsR family regulator
MDYKNVERIVKGFANHRRIEILDLLNHEPDLSLFQISEKLNINLKTASEHTSRLLHAGLIYKKYKGRQVIHKLSSSGSIILTFCRKLE